MPSQTIPRREPINETLMGAVSRLGDAYLLSDATLPRAEPVLAGDLVVRYGIPYLGKSHLSIVPDLLVLDYGEMLVGDIAWEFLMKSSHLFPRSDVLGYRNDGADEMLAFKQLDFDSPYHVFVYRDRDDHQPVCRLNALISADRASFPERLLTHIACFSNLDDWLHNG